MTGDFNFDFLELRPRSMSLYLQINPALSTLDFRRNFGARMRSITADGVSKLCAALCILSTSKLSQNAPRVRQLWFGGNDIGDSGLESLCALMRASVWLQDLYLFGCGISNQGAVSL
jgi:hypothetical protein